jgi:2-polyprenyl-6-methoxyphenol hydroxylase-like FAD-dependent oxidoreductase
VGPRVAIIGCGIGGLTTAIALAQAGIEVAVYEQAPELGEVGAGVGMWANALRALHPLGMSDAVLALSAGPVSQGVRLPEGRWLLRQPREAMEARWGAGFISVHRAELHTLLASAVDPATIHLGVRCTGFEQTGATVRVHFADGPPIETDVLVGADGVHSIVRSGLSGPARLRYRGYTNWRGVTPPGSVPPIAEVTETWGRGARFGLQPTSGDRILWYAGRNVAAGGVDDVDVRPELLETFGHWHEPIAAVIEATPEGSLVRNDIYDCWPTKRWSRGAVTLVGDAVHPMTPDLGQGACQAIVDGTTLARCLAEIPDVPQALDAYRRSRFRNAAIATLFARAWGSYGKWDGLLTCAIRNAAVRAMPLWLQLRQLDLVVGRPSRSTTASR